jgi:predicted DNA-binding transcriptional regulator AlpA
MSQQYDMLTPMKSSALIRVGSRYVAPEELAALSEIAQMLGVTTRTVQRYMEREDFPEPLGRLAGGRVWLRADVERWAKQVLPLPEGRPRKESDG